jgi:hypothetical protein
MVNRMGKAAAISSAVATRETGFIIRWAAPGAKRRTSMPASSGTIAETNTIGAILLAGI